MRHERKSAFAKVDGMLIRQGIPPTDEVWETLKTLEANVGHIDADQITLIETLLERAMIAKASVVRKAMIKAVQAVE